MNLMKNSNYLKWEKIIYHLQSLTNQNIVLYIKHIQQPHSTTKTFIYIYSQKISIRIRRVFMVQLETKRFPIHTSANLFVFIYQIMIHIYFKACFIYLLTAKLCEWACIRIHKLLSGNNEIPSNNDVH